MGRSAKLHKRVKPKINSATSSQPTPAQIQVQAAKKKATVKEKTAKNASMRKEGDRVLGGADYVSLLMGGRKKAREEGAKLPQGG
ncbi:hypothetical protein BT96DRAFT_923830 [Gymnopus androsaceus JB14]|uniref:Uncharacterized protein n=1 Tax=Gymnopus androsaceus JB14 TaxID=1447944 RepID=A0A6A4H6S0_9AGAR|nr:hypothetical protein BT96DRAFT_923830 [Gymnopus androsaceus JB14]